MTTRSSGTRPVPTSVPALERLGLSQADVFIHTLHTYSHVYFHSRALHAFIMGTSPLVASYPRASNSQHQPERVATQASEKLSFACVPLFELVLVRHGHKIVIKASSCARADRNTPRISSCQLSIAKSTHVGESGHQQSLEQTRLQEVTVHDFEWQAAHDS